MNTVHVQVSLLIFVTYSTGPFQKSYDTTSDFWRMIFQERCETLVMLTQPVENGVGDCILLISGMRNGSELTLAMFAGGVCLVSLLQ